MLSPYSIETLTLSDEEVASFTKALGDERLLTREQAAAFLHVSPRTIDYWMANLRERRRHGRKPAKIVKGPGLQIAKSRERLPYIKLGHKVFFQLGDLRRFRDERRVAA
jgi:hypothetical protein